MSKRRKEIDFSLTCLSLNYFSFWYVLYLSRLEVLFLLTNYILFTQFFRQFTSEDRQVKLPLNISAAGDITLIIYHARSTFGGKIQGKVSIVCYDRFNIYRGPAKNPKCTRHLASKLENITGQILNLLAKMLRNKSCHLNS